ncbi:MAG: molybdate ABC transporter substrate-binding protein [Acidobacteria bacterium]|nr:molybdate ABC transporter substrate-binding protein [Acidobacteriota bacterium]
MLLLLALVAAVPAPAPAQGLTIAAASDLQSVMPIVADRFEQATGQTVTVTFGSSGNFFSQIQNGAPFDLFFSADIDYPRRLAADGLVEPGSITLYAIGRLVLWARRASTLDVARGLQTLLDPRVRRVAIANPETAPYGRAAVAALRHAGLYDRVRPKLVLGENVAQAAQFVDSGNADAGLIAESLALDPRLRDRGVSHEIPAGDYPPIEQAAAIVQASSRKPAARAFLAFLRTPAIVRLMQTYGFTAGAAVDGAR